MRIQSSGNLYRSGSACYNPNFKQSAVQIRSVIKQEASDSLLHNKTILGKSYIKKAIDSILAKFYKKTDKNIPEVKEALIAALFGRIQTEEDFYKDIAQAIAEDKYIQPNIKTNAEVIDKLERKGIIETQHSWEPPRFENGRLSDYAYKDIIAKIKGAPSWQLSDYEKKNLINELAKSNYHNEDIIVGNINFRGSEINGDTLPHEEGSIPISELPENPSFEELLNTDISLPDELQSIVDMPVAEVDSDLVSDIMADLPDGFEPDADLLENLRGLTGEILDMLG